MTLSVSSRDEQPQQLIMVPGHKEEDSEKHSATVLTIVYHPTLNGERLNPYLILVVSPDRVYAISTNTENLQ